MLESMIDIYLGLGPPRFAHDRRYPHRHPQPRARRDDRDRAPRPATEAALRDRALPRGEGGTNVSRAIKALGGESRAFVALGGATGTHHRQLLEAAGVAHDVCGSAGRDATLDDGHGDRNRSPLSLCSSRSRTGRRGRRAHPRRTIRDHRERLSLCRGQRQSAARASPPTSMAGSRTSRAATVLRSSSTPTAMPWEARSLTAPTSSGSTIRKRRSW